MLPIPFSKYIPGYSDGASKTALANKADTNIEAWKNDVLDVQNLFNADRCPAKFLDYLGELVGADIRGDDTEREKREKIYNAVHTTKRKGLWEAVKVVVDAYCGGDSRLLTFVGADDWIMVGKELYPTYYWAGMGGKTLTGDYGIHLYGKGLEPEVKGVIWIDVDNSTLTFDEVEVLKDKLKNHTPCYFYVYLGYMVAGVFTPYPNGLMS